MISFALHFVYWNRKINFRKAYETNEEWKGHRGLSERNCMFADCLVGIRVLKLAARNDDKCRFGCYDSGTDLTGAEQYLSDYDPR